MKQYRIMLNGIDAVKSFVNIINSYNIQADLHCGSYAVDAQSILGIFTLNLTKELELIVRSIRPENYIEEFENDIKSFVIT